MASAASPHLQVRFPLPRLGSAGRSPRMPVLCSYLGLPAPVFGPTTFTTAARQPKVLRGSVGNTRVTWAATRRRPGEHAGLVPAAAARLISQTALALGTYKGPKDMQIQEKVEVHEDFQFRDPSKDNNVGPDGQLKWGTFDHREWYSSDNLKQQDISEIQDQETRRRAQLRLARLESPFLRDLDTKLQDIEGVEEHSDEPTETQWEAWRAVWTERRYLRKSLYEIPKLKEFSKPFEPPTEKHYLKFTTHYNPTNRSSESARTVKLEVQIKNLNLNPKQLHKFLLLIGSHYDPQNQGFVLETCRYAHVAQNKKWLSDVMDDLMEETLDPTDDFSDIPLNPHLVRNKYNPPLPNFPEAWKRPQPEVTAEEVERARAVWLSYCQESMSALFPQELDLSKTLTVDDELGI